MEQAIAQRPRFEIRPGTTVITADNEDVGKVDMVVVRPGNGDVMSVVIRKGLVLRRDVVVPIDAVTDATPDVVYLNLTKDEVNRLPEYHEPDYVLAPEGWGANRGRSAENVVFLVPWLELAPRPHPAPSGQSPAAAGGRPLRAGQRVFCRDGEVGKLDLVLIDPTTRRATHFVVRRGGPLGKDTVIPVEWASLMTRDEIFLDVGREELDKLPEYRDDDRIESDVLSALWDDTDLPPAELQFVEVRVRDGIVELRGNTLTEDARAKIEDAVRTVPGVLGVRNQLTSFERLAAELVARQEAHARAAAAGAHDARESAA